MHVCIFSTMRGPRVVTIPDDLVSTPPYHAQAEVFPQPLVGGNAQCDEGAYERQ